MTGTEFYDAVDAHPELGLAGIRKDDETGAVAILVRHPPTKALYAVEPDAVTANDWSTLEEVLTGRRDARILGHMTRIVGYYSQVENWNKSKLGELEARRAAVDYYQPESIS